MSEVPEIAAYSPEEIESARTWPAIERYLQLINQTPATPRDELRIRRHIAWLRCALATFHDRADAESVCALWSTEAEKIITEAWKSAGCDAAGFGLIALGKLGAGELNLSSDVDLIIVRPDHVAPDLKIFRDFQAILSDSTELGFCLRTDFSLRPGGRGASAIPSVSEFEYHYGYHGEMWERLAYVRMRFLHGTREIIDEITKFTRKFSFRKHLDYTLLDELKALRSKIRTEKFDARPDIFHLKLGEGGIRELELFVHALQVMHGGRHPLLQTNSTTIAIGKIQDLALLPPEECEDLSCAYWYLRTLENRLHGFEDQQTYSIDLKRGHQALPDDFRSRLPELRSRVVKISTSLFGEDVPSGLMPDSSEMQKEWLKERGFSQRSQEETWPALLSATAISHRSEADERARSIFLQGFTAKLAEIKLDRDLGLSLLLDFVRAVRAKASFFTLLNRETRARDELAVLFSISPYLGNLLASRPELIDEFIFRKQAEPSEDFNTLLEELAERRLLAELIAASQFLTDRDIRKMTLNLTANADAISVFLLDRLREDLGAGEVGLVALGKWGGRELGLKSDLDFIFVTPDSPSAEDQKVAKRFISRMTEPHRGGSIYAIDLRLRPTGNAGPIMVPKGKLEHYLSVEAAAWERQAYLRARPLTNLNFHPARTAACRGLSEGDVRELRMIREKLFSPFGETNVAELDLKLTFGGLADVEFCAQIALLTRREFSLDTSTSGMIEYLEGVDATWREVGPSLRENYETLRRLEQLYQLTTSQSGSKMRLKSDEYRRLAMIIDSTPTELEERVRSIFKSARSHLDLVDRL